MRPSRPAALTSPVLAAAAALLTATSIAHAEERRVPEDYPTIQAAIDAAVDGDVVSIAAGEYPSTGLVIDRSIHIRGRAGATGTILRAKGANAIIRISTQAVGPVTLEGLSIRDWTSSVDRPAVEVAGGETAILACHFSGCVNAAGGGGALRVNAPLSIQRCVFLDNSSAIGGAIFGGPLQISDSLFARNRAVNPSGPDEGGAIHTTSLSASIVRTTFIGNQADIGGAICRAWGSSVSNIASCIFGANTSNWNCCIACTDCGAVDPTILDADCDQDGIPDAAMIILDPSLDADGDGLLDRCGCPADLVADGSVNGADVAVLLNFWGTDGAGYPGVDLDGDGIVGGTDLATMLGAWGACPE